MCKKLESMSREAIGKVLENGIQTSDVEILYKLTKINKMVEEEDKMYGNYGEYGNYGARGRYNEGYGRDSYGEYNAGSYGRRGRDSKYRGDDHLERMYSEYGRYNESRNRYGAGNEESNKSFQYMVQSLEDFLKVLYEEADTPQEKQMLRETLQRSMR